MRADFSLQLVELLRQFFVAGHHVAQMNEGAYNHEADFDGALRFQHVAQHERAVFGEGVG